MPGFLGRLFGPRAPAPREVHVGARFRSGETCPVTGTYIFDGYVRDPIPTPYPSLAERRRRFVRGERFPAIELYAQPCWWRLVAKEEE